MARLILGFLPFRFVLRILSAYRQLPSLLATPTAQQLHGADSFLSKHFTAYRRCLLGAVTLYIYLSSNQNLALVMGIKQPEGQIGNALESQLGPEDAELSNFRAHAWIECPMADQVLSQDKNYREIYRLSA